jgi:hypothetical protein
LFLANILLLSSQVVFGEVIELNKNQHPSVVMKDFEFSVINYFDNSRASKEAIRIFESAEQVFAETSKRADKIGWG